MQREPRHTSTCGGHVLQPSALLNAGAVALPTLNVLPHSVASFSYANSTGYHFGTVSSMSAVKSHRKYVRKRRDDLSWERRKPNCPYHTLIAMSMMANESQIVSVRDIGAYIQTEFPYLVASEHTTWKSHVLHSLTRSSYFRQAQNGQSTILDNQLWEIVPDWERPLKQQVWYFIRDECTRLLREDYHKRQAMSPESRGQTGAEGKAAITDTDTTAPVNTQVVEKATQKSFSIYHKSGETTTQQDPPVQTYLLLGEGETRQLLPIRQLPVENTTHQSLPVAQHPAESTSQQAPPSISQLPIKGISQQSPPMQQKPVESAILHASSKCQLSVEGITRQPPLECHKPVETTIQKCPAMQLKPQAKKATIEYFPAKGGKQSPNPRQAKVVLPFTLVPYRQDQPCSQTRPPNITPFWALTRHVRPSSTATSHSPSIPGIPSFLYTHTVQSSGVRQWESSVPSSDPALVRPSPASLPYAVQQTMHTSDSALSGRSFVQPTHIPGRSPPNLGISTASAEYQKEHVRMNSHANSDGMDTQASKTTEHGCIVSQTGGRRGTLRNREEENLTQPTKKQALSYPCNGDSSQLHLTATATAANVHTSSDHISGTTTETHSGEQTVTSAFISLPPGCGGRSGDILTEYWNEVLGSSSQNILERSATREELQIVISESDLTD